MVGYNKYSDKLKSTDYAIAGALSGFITRALCQPFDVLKIRFQLQVEPIVRSPHSKYHSVPQAFVQIYKEEGWKAFWKGHVPAQMLSIVFGLTQFWVFESLTRQEIIKSNQSSTMNFICGSIGGVCASVVTFPFDVLRTRLAAQHEAHRNYSGIHDAILKIKKYETIPSFFRGLLPTVLQVGPHTGLQFMSYNFFDGIFRTFTKMDREAYSFMETLISGSLAGLVAKTVVYPFDLLRKRLQVQSLVKYRKGFGKPFKCKRITECFKTTLHEEGVKGLFKGLFPSLIKAVFTTGLHFSMYECILKLFVHLRKLSTNNK